MYPPSPRYPTLVLSFLGILLLLSAFFPCRSAFGQGTPEPALREARILPTSIDATHLGVRHRIQLQEVAPDGAYLGKWTDGVEWQSSDPSVFRVEGDHVISVGNGTAELSATWKGKRVGEKVRVQVRLADRERTIEFRNHVEAVLARSGCNMGACHGALAGKGGFRLSLRGYDPATDYFNMTRQDRGRRIELSEPAESLLLTKPSGILPHKGGVRIPPDSDDYRILADWIARGAPGPTEKDPRLESVEVFPSEVRLGVGREQPLIVRARYDDGRTEDVTQWAKFSSTDDSVINVDEHGTVKVVGPGEGSIVVWFASRIVMSRMTVPFANQVQDVVYERGDIANEIDLRVLKQLQQLRLAPSPRCEDHEFIRRAFLDTIGLLPSAEEAQAFIADRSENKRSRLIDELLNRPEYVDYWAYRWSDLLMLNGNLLRPEPIKTYYQWIREHVKKNTPWDQFTREILTARGDSVVQGATNFYALNQDPESMTENACQAFMGLSIGCAKCHNHPLEKWTNDQYYGMANLFARVRAKGWGGDSRDGDGIRTLLVLDRGDLIQPLTGKPQLPAPLDAPPLSAESTEDRRLYLAKWMTSPENPYFTKAIVNRVWANFFGIGIVNAVDDMRASNPPSNPELLRELERYLVANQYDLKALMKLILESETYQRSSLVIPGNEGDTHFFARYYPKRLMAEVLHDILAQTTGVPTKFTEIEFQGADKKPTDFYPVGTRAIQLYDSAVRSNFLKTFGRNQRRITCECERSDESSVVQVLHLSNGSTLNEKLVEKGSLVDKLLECSADKPEELVRKAYWICLGREVQPGELTLLVEELKKGEEKDRRSIVEDLLWGLMTSREFLYNH